MSFDDVWNEDEFGMEFVKFHPAAQIDVALYDDKVEVLYCEIHYQSIVDNINQWNKKRKVVFIDEIRRCDGTPNKNDIILDFNDVHLDMGARLFKAVKKAYENKWKYVKILKVSSVSNKFEVHYYVSEYKLVFHKDIKKTKTTKK